MKRLLTTGAVMLVLACAAIAHAGLGTPDLTGTWKLTIRGLGYDLAANSAAERVLEVDTTATMKITQSDGGKLYIQIDGATGLLALWTPKPEFTGEGYVGNNSWLGIDCWAYSIYAQTLSGTVDSNGKAMTGDWQIIYNGGSETSTSVLKASFVGFKKSGINPNIPPCIWE